MAFVIKVGWGKKTEWVELCPNLQISQPHKNGK
jgi:hypothetical protein